MYNHSRTFHLFLSRKITALYIVSLLVLSSISFVHAQASGSEWVSFTLRRVNLRQAPTIRSYLKTVLDEGIRVHVFDEVQGLDDEISGWLHVYVDEGDSGWVSRDFIVPKAALERFPELKSALMQSPTIQEEAKVEIPEDSIPGFSEGLKEPVDITKQEAEEEGSFFDPFLMPLLLLSILANLFLAYRLRVVSKAKAILSDSDTLNKKYQLLLNTNRNLDKQIEKLTQENSNLHKELEDIHNNLNKSTENIQQQAIKFTMAEQTHKEERLSKDNEIQRLQIQHDELQQSKAQLEKESLEKTDYIKKTNASLQTKIQELEKTLEEKDKSIDEQIAQAKIDVETSLEKQFEDRLNEVQKTQEKKYLQQVEAVNAAMEKEKTSILGENKDLQQKLKAIEIKYVEEKKLRHELEVQTGEFEKIETSKEAEFEDLQKEYNALLSSYEEAQQQLKNAQTAWEAERKILSKPVPAGADIERTIPEEKAVPETAGEEVETPEKVMQISPVPADADQHEEYARNFFKKFRKL